MIDTRRTRQMTKMAIYESHHSEDYKTTVRHDKKEYVGLWSIIYTIAAVLLGLLYIFAAWYIIITLNPDGIGTIWWILFGVVSIVGFVCHIYFYVKISRKKAEARYDKSKQQSDYIEEQYKILEEMYEEHS
ncbi:MAG: hypothetical protein K5644_06630 [Lachnospiraceae bacterium]|nr:hypothetical protein [Lachnospiraceae bacterium]